MKIFKLPDLGEGLPDAIIREWYIKAGDQIEKDQPMVAMETAKALVDVPAPFSGKIEKLFGNANDTVETGHALIGFEGEADLSDIKKDTGTVVGKIEQSEQVISELNISDNKINATPAIRALARKLNVDITKIKFSGDRITEQDIKNSVKTVKSALKDGFENLSGIKRAMILNMQRSHQDIVPVTLSDEADIHAWTKSPVKQDTTVRIIRAIITACQKEPALNAHFDGENHSVKKFKEINLGLAVDVPHGLYVPVLKDVANKSDEEIRALVEKFKAQAQTKSIAQDDLHGATIVLSNFGTIAGRYANPIILPPTVAIVGVGRIAKSVVPDENNQPAVHRMVPLSMSVDHRAITGGEVARFLRALMDALSQSSAALDDNTKF